MFFHVRSFTVVRSSDDFRDCVANFEGRVDLAGNRLVIDEDCESDLLTVFRFHISGQSFAVYDIPFIQQIASDVSAGLGAAFLRQASFARYLPDSRLDRGSAANRRSGENISAYSS